jgi:hypothetical protein
MKAADPLSPFALFRTIERAARHQALSSSVLWLLTFMLWAAGGKMNISWPPTMDPSVACRRPKTTTPHPPAPTGHELVKSTEGAEVVLELPEPPQELLASPDSEGGADDSEAKAPAGPSRCVLRPRYLQPFFQPQHHLSPPA